MSEKEVKKYILSFTMDKKHQIVSYWMVKMREVGHKDLDFLFALDDIWSEVYEKHRIKTSFGEAMVIANKYILKIIYGE